MYRTRFKLSSIPEYPDKRLLRSVSPACMTYHESQKRQSIKLETSSGSDVGREKETYDIDVSRLNLRINQLNNLWSPRQFLQQPNLVNETRSSFSIVPRIDSFNRVDFVTFRENSIDFRRSSFTENTGSMIRFTVDLFQIESRSQLSVLWLQDSERERHTIIGLCFCFRGST